MTLLVILMIAATVLSYMFYDIGMMLSSFLVAIVAILQGVSYTSTNNTNQPC